MACGVCTGNACGQRVHVCASVEKAWPRLIASSYLVVTGLIKDDEPTVGLSAAPLSLTSFGRKIDRQPPVSHYVVFGKETGIGG